MPGDNLFARDWNTSARDYWLPLLICALTFAIWLVDGNGRAASLWGVSWPALQGGAYPSLVLHMLAHGDLIHLLVNSSVLVLVGGPLVSRLGRPLLAWSRFLYVLLGSGASGALLFLALNRGEESAMVGSSGAIFGLVAALARVHPVTGTATRTASRRTWLLAEFFTLNHAGLFAILALVALIWGKVVIVAWEAHLGGAIFGFLLTPLFLPRNGD